MKRKQLPHHLAQSMQPYFSMYCLKKKGRKRNMAKYKQRKDGRYYTSITLGEKKYYIYGQTIKEIDKKKIDITIKYQQGLQLKSKETLFKNYKEEWFKVKAPLIGPKSAQNYRSILNNHCDRIDYKKISNIKKIDIQMIINDLLDKPNTANKVFMTLNQIFKSAIDDDIIIKNPCSRIVKPKIETKNKKRILTDEEFYLTEIADFNDREKMFVILSKYCGLRPEETRALTKNDFIIENNSGYLIINKTVIYTSNQPIFQRFTKNDSSIREIPLFSNILPFVKYYLTTLKNDKLFTNISGGNDYLTYQSYKWLVKKIIDKIEAKALELNIEFNQEGFTLYIFRHTFATLLYYSNVRLKDAQYYMGHKDSKMLNQVYIHLDKQKLRENVIVENFVIEKIKNTTENIESKLLSTE